jgi:hypothetical protein
MELINGTIQDARKRIAISEPRLVSWIIRHHHTNRSEQFWIPIEERVEDKLDSQWFENDWFIKEENRLFNEKQSRWY